MAVAIVMDFPGGTREQYDMVVGRMHLDGMLPPGAIHHSAGPTDGGWRVVDVWESKEQFLDFRDTRILPLAMDAGMAGPRSFTVDLHNVERGPASDEPHFVQVFHNGMDVTTYDTIHAQVAQPLPEGVVWHVAGPLGDGWVIIDAWTSRDQRDRFVFETVVPTMNARGELEPPRVDDLDVEATLRSPSSATLY
jgi:hypothetical protein